MIKKCILLCCLCGSVAAMQAQTRKYVNDYLQIGVGARGLGMSGAQNASIDDVTSPFWNPAGLSHVQSDMQAGLMHAEYFSGIAKYDYLGTAFRLKNQQGTLGFSLIRFAIDDIPYTLNLIQPDGSVDYTKIKAISSQDYAGLISYGRTLTHACLLGTDATIRIGANMKILHRSIGSMANAWGGGLDIGAQAELNQWRIGAVIKDVTTTYTLWSFNFTDQEKLVLAQTGNAIVSKSSEVATPKLVLGGARLFNLGKKTQMLAELNFDVTSDGKRYGNLINVKPFSIDPRAGVEFNYNQVIYLRAGAGNIQRILSDQDTLNQKKVTLFQPTLGLGLKMKSLHLDYAFTSLNMQSNPLYSHFISLKVDINRKHHLSTEGETPKAATPKGPGTK